MVERDVVFAKLDTIDRCLRRLQETGSRRDVLTEVDVRDLQAVNLQRAIQAAIDLAFHVVASEVWGVPQTLAAVFGLLAERGVIDDDLAGDLRRMVGFRNIAVHQYAEIDPGVLDTIVEQHLDDLRALGRTIVTRYRLAD